MIKVEGQTKLPDPVKLAVDEFKKIYDKIFSDNSSSEGKNVGDSFRARAREMPEMISEVGLLPTIIFCYSKATDEYYKKIYNLLEKNSTSTSSSNPSQQGSEQQKKDERASATKLGYALYLYILLRGLQEYDIFKIAQQIDKPFDIINELSKKLGEEIYVLEKLLYPYLAQIKRLSEATLTSQE